MAGSEEAPLPFPGSPADAAEPVDRLAVLRRLAAALLHPPLTVLFHGEAGIGKSHLLAETEALAATMGYRVLHGQARDFGSGLAYASLADALGTLRTDPAAGEPLGELLDAIDQAALGATGAAPAVRTANLLEALPGRTFLAIDDLHLADADTLSALSYLPRRVRGLVVAGTARRPPAMDADLAIRLGPLSREEVAALVTGLLGRTPSEATVRRIHEESRGNPWFAREAVLTLVQGGAVQAAVPVPRRGALLSRLFQRDQGGRGLARVLAALRRTRPAGLADLPVLAEVAGLDAAEAERAFDGLIRDGLVLPAGGDAYDFAHPLVAEALYADLGPAERRRVHARIADLLRDRGLDGTRTVLEWATHVAEGGSGAEALTAMLRAAETTRWTAPLSAAHWYGRAAELAPPEEAGVLLSRQTLSYWKGSRPADALRAGRAALAVLTPGRRHTRTAQTVVNAAHAMGRYELAVSIAAEQLPHADDPTALLAQQAVIGTQLGLDSADAAAGAAWRALPGCPPQDLVIALSALAGDAIIKGRWARTERALTALLSASAALPPAGRLAALESAAHILASAGARTRALDLLSQAEQIYRGLGWRDIAGQHARTMAVVRRLGGEWEHALREIRSDALALTEAGLWENAALLRNIEVDILLDQGRYDEAGRLLDDPPPNCVLQRSLRALFKARRALALGDRAAAARLLDEAAAGPPDVRHRELAVRVNMHVTGGDLAAARAAAADLAQAAGTGTPRARMSADLAMAMTFGDAARAEGALEAARADGLRFEEGKARLVLGALAGDGAQLTRAQAIFADLGAVPWRDRAGRALASAGLAPSPAAGLTPAERRVIELVAAGMSNPQIAGELHYSRKTVEVYLSRVYAKTGLRSRVELALAHERGEL
ncbi:hypothetical protein Sme01_17930 [Sphaerisporangium melleum]|uniref:HTH luxR-type domain-containing protein n=1 Tax=Sphaerisporangium melleum TaxID=321316 RepID=A0A917R2H6_9ACTN|nr:LuxR C-terminal-related transcriptional regulator [Sphaerisporangium melleum]GGK83837.1 hypothetical protein GCM10007964_27870 [Sphaerisporangium melleum]GII69317.1 hypothetical protein Sme01_17930 [Sphaerisporangium melleum]